jgi:cobalt-zinc-cadmium efflux system membrane fusion protein
MIALKPFRLLLTVVGLSGCATRVAGDEKTEKKPASDTGMAGMPMSGDSATSGKLPPTVTMTAAQIEHGGVKWGPVFLGTVSQAATVPGEITPNEDRTWRLGAPARGRIVSVSVRPGDAVREGLTLVTMQSPDAGMAQSDVAKAAAEVNSRRAEVQFAASARARAERLLALKAIPKQDYDRSVSDDEHAKAALAQAEAEVSRARATARQLSADANANGEMILRAPHAGVVLARMAVPGAVVDAGAPLVVVTDPASLWLTINAPEAMSMLFHRADRLRFIVSALPADTFRARVSGVGAGLDPETRTLNVRADVESDIRLKPQMLATVLVGGGRTGQQPMVPDDAVRLLQGKPFVFVVHAKERGEAEFERRAVVPGARANGTVVLQSGVNAGDVIVIAGAFAVKTAFEKSIMPKMEM